MIKKITILGSTGSIGAQVLDVVSSNPKRFKVVGLCANTNVKALAQQAKRFRPKVVAIKDSSRYLELKKSLNSSNIRLSCGKSGIEEVASFPEADIVVVASVGSDALLPTISAINAKKDIALANKEIIVSAGQILNAFARKKNVKILPIDSEQSAIFQCLNSEKKGALKKIILTGSGGPLKDIQKKSFNRLTPEQVINHPKWKMGRKISVDSATLMNKGLEVIEAHFLFDVDMDKIQVLIHPEAIVHSMVEFVDGSVLAQLGPTDMRLPIQYALSFPERIPTKIQRLDFVKLKTLTFEKPDFERFPCLGIAVEAGKKAGTTPAVLNASNEELVSLYLKRRIRFSDIPRIMRKVLQKHKNTAKPKLDDILAAENWAREETHGLCSY